MIVVFVVDTSPSMGEPIQNVHSSNNKPGFKSKSSSVHVGMSRLDLAKMTVESLTKMMERRVHDHNLQVQTADDASPFKSLHNLGFGFAANDQFLLLSTGCQHSSQSTSMACGAGGRLLVSFGPNEKRNDVNSDHAHAKMHTQKIEFEQELKRLKATEWKKGEESFPEDGGGASGLNAALSTGLQLLSRHRLQNRFTENFGLGRLPSNAIMTPNVGAAGGVGGMQQATSALQPACLILLTDGDCLRKLPSEGGGSLQLQFGNIPLREFYQEPFRWDQRIFCLGVGPSGDKPHPSLRAFSDVTGGCHSFIRSVSDIPQVTNLISRLIAPRLPSPWPIVNPLKLPHVPAANSDNDTNLNGAVFVNGGPVCSFQVLERNSAGQPGTIHRAMILYTPSWTNEALKGSQKNHVPPPPIWCLPESFYPSKRMETLPPRTAQPLLSYTRYYQALGTCAFDPMKVMQMLHRLDHFVVSNRSMSHGSQQVAGKLLQRDVYVCQWLSQDGRDARGPSSQRGLEHFPIFVRGAGRSSLADGEENVINIGILRVPTEDVNAPSTLTLLPPDPHVLLPLLLKAAETEHRKLKKASAAAGDSAKLLNVSKNLLLDDNWRSEMRAYLFRVPPYYHPHLRRCLRTILPPSVHSLLSSDSSDSALSQCMSRTVIQKIRNAEQITKANNERQEQREGEFRRQSAETNQYVDVGNLRYGQFDCRSTSYEYLNVLRNLPKPKSNGTEEQDDPSNEDIETKENMKPLSVIECIGDLPHECLLAFYESRRKWIFGGSGLTTRGIFVDGVHNCTNSHHYKAKRSFMDESLLSIAGVGASALNKTKINKMGDFKERLLFTNQPIIGYGSNDSVVSPISTAPDGSPVWSLSDESLPAALFDQNSGEFVDSAQARIRARLMINFGNPFKDKRGDSIVPQEFIKQRPPTQQSISEASSPQGSPPHNAFSGMEGEEEAELFGLSSPPRIDKENGRKRADSPMPPPTKEKKFKTVHNPTKVTNVPKQKTSDSTEPKRPPAPPMPKPRPPIPPPKAHKKPPPNKPRPQRPPNQQRPPPPKPSKPAPSKDASKASPSTLNKQQIPRPPAPSKNDASKSMPPHPSKQHVSKPPAPKRYEGSKAPLSTPNKQQTSKPPPPPSQSPSAKPNINLPPGWICVWSKREKKWYFFDKTTNKSVWQWPPPGGLR